jgi:hypothetical protein
MRLSEIQDGMAGRLRSGGLIRRMSQRVKLPQRPVLLASSQVPVASLAQSCAA